MESTVVVGRETENFSGRVMTGGIKVIARVEEGHGSAMVQLLEVGAKVVCRWPHEELGR